jgi:hypothetical protein
MAADITCSARYKNRHAVTRTRNRFAILAQLGAKPLSYRIKMRAVYGAIFAGTPPDRTFSPDLSAAVARFSLRYKSPPEKPN